jgi:hypothetical protein
MSDPVLFTKLPADIKRNITLELLNRSWADLLYYDPEVKALSNEMQAIYDGAIGELTAAKEAGKKLTAFPLHASDALKAKEIELRDAIKASGKPGASDVAHHIAAARRQQVMKDFTYRSRELLAPVIPRNRIKQQISGDTEATPESKGR